MPELINVNVIVNNETVQAQVRPDMNLMEFLRDYLGLTGTKNGCSSGHCGSCSVILNGKLRRACLVRMSKVNGCQVETIEALAQNGNLHPLQYSFVEQGAVQCGFCTPGMIMASKALLDNNPDPTRDEIKTALTKNNNLCRCTGYLKIFDAIEAAGKMMREEEIVPPIAPEGDRVRSTLLTRDAVGLVTGTTLFGDDISEEGMLHGKILWAEHPHAEILNIDTTEAEVLDGVELVITAKDIPGKNQAGIVVRDQPAIAEDKTRYIGDSLAAVFASTPEIAQEAVSKIKVEYKVLRGVFTPEEASAPDAPKVHKKGNLAHHAKIERGDVDDAFANCAVVVEGEYSTPFIEHGFMEPESGIAYPRSDGGVVLKMGTQCAFDVRTQLSEILDMPEEKIRVVQLPIGGAFGGKEDLIIEQHLALGAKLSGKPVKIVLTRKESLRVHVKRHPAWMQYKTGADENGRILAIESNVILDAGAYMSLSFDVMENTIVFGAGPYYVPNLRLEAWAWHTNNVLCGAMRGFGVNQVAVAIEQQLDEIASRLGIDPFTIRLINGLDVDLPTAADHILPAGVVSIKDTVAAAQREFQKLQLPDSNGEKKIGYGVASAVKNIGFGHGLPERAGAIIELDSEGNAVLRHSQHEYGQGAFSGIAKLVSLELGLPIDNIQIVGPDTDRTPPTGPTTASRQTYMTGNATVMVCRALKDEIFSRAAEILEQEPSKLKLDGKLVVDPETGNSIELSEIGRKFVVEREYNPSKTDPLLEDETSHYGKPGFESRATHWCYAYNTQVAVVEVDTRTGDVKVLTVISANDLGNVLNRTVVEGQIHGGVVMGMGYALSEEYLVENGVNLTNTLRKCKIPSADMTPEIIPAMVEVPHPEGPLGVKGFAEAPSLATAPAILNAIYDATGVRITDIPADKKRLKAALENHTNVL
ncbi:MAG: molybdopterin-dependent oxidoreductase [Anaerolineales bacterium]|nr:molybdopterin-dependent oxidoreductase [Chloroflexota bacterium]MBL6981979.1 molybdopterin-dependent oxidoreductase [Anaerolineales bacterium]